MDVIVGALARPGLRAQALLYVVDLAPGRAAAFAPYLRTAEPRTRLDVIEALGVSEHPAALPVVEPFASDNDPDVALAAQRAVARIRAAAAS